MEKLKKLIELSKEHKAFHGDHGAFSKNQIHLNSLPRYKTLEKVKLNLEIYQECDFEFHLESQKLEICTWFKDRHTGTHDYIERREIELTEENKKDLISYLENLYEGILKTKLREEVIQEFTNKRFDELMGIVNFI